MSMCFEWAEIDGEFDKEHAAWLLDKIGKGRGTGKRRKPRSTHNHKASLNAWDIA